MVGRVSRAIQAEGASVLLSVGAPGFPACRAVPSATTVALIWMHDVAAAVAAADDGVKSDEVKPLQKTLEPEL